MMPTFENPSLHTFSYKLIGLEERWITLNKGEKTASFSSVPHGEYLLVVKGANHDGIWSEETKLKIEIIPAFWDTIWFKVFVSISLFTIAFALVSSRIRRLKKEKEIQRDLTNKLLNSQEEERKNISSELHDDLGQNLLVVKNRLMLARRDRIYEKNIDESLDILDLSIHKISNISHLLHPSELEELGLSLAIETMIDRIQTAAELLVNTNFHNFDDYFADEEKINVFRIIQEAMNNVIKHANATKVNLSTKIENKDFVLLISDNGKGFEILEQNSSENRPHLGLKGMKERVIMLKGKMKVNSQKGKGTAISIIFSNRIKNENR
jgi:signal transduction histidine kinase